MIEIDTFKFNKALLKLLINADLFQMLLRKYVNQITL